MILFFFSHLNADLQNSIQSCSRWVYAMEKLSMENSNRKEHSYSIIYVSYVVVKNIGKIKPQCELNIQKKQTINLFALFNAAWKKIIQKNENIYFLILMGLVCYRKSNYNSKQIKIFPCMHDYASRIVIQFQWRHHSNVQTIFDLFCQICQIWNDLMPSQSCT